MSHSVLITGSSRGIGRAIAANLAQKGWSIVVHGSRESDELASIVKELGPSCAGQCVRPLQTMEDGASLWDEAVQQAGSLSALVNNAGIYVPHRAAARSREEFSDLAGRMMGVNFLAPLGLTHAACSQWIASDQTGRIVQVASRVGLKGEAGASLYASSKAALINLVKSLAAEQASQRVYHFAIAPGWVDTAMARDGMTQRLEEILAGIPFGRMATPEDCAGAAAWLLSGEADYMTGLTIDINGASYMR
jgi:3-oxoacyl-[acyl-carrier protein] reductase